MNDYRYGFEAHRLRSLACDMLLFACNCDNAGCYYMGSELKRVSFTILELENLSVYERLIMKRFVLRLLGSLVKMHKYKQRMRARKVSEMGRVLSQFA